MSYLKKILIAIVITIVAILGYSTISKAAYEVGDKVKLNYQDYLNRSDLYCIEHNERLWSGNDVTYEVVSIFLTFYDVHIIRMPINGVVKRLKLPPYFVENRPMLSLEKDIMNSKFSSVRKELISCFAYNERVLYSINDPLKEGNMFMLLTADYDIDTILPFTSQIQALKQNQRLASIRYGSMVTCIVPKQWNCKFVCKENIHIEAGIDALFMYE